jgi:hypothetical protein
MSLLSTRCRGAGCRLAVALVAVALAAVSSSTAQALFQDAPAVAANDFATAALEPPTGLLLDSTCTSSALTTVTVDATWTASPSAFATGYRLERWKGATLDDTVSITPASTTSFTDMTAAPDTTYQYRLVATYENWTSTVVADTVTTGCASAGATSIWRRHNESSPLAASWVGNSIVSTTLTAPVGKWRIMQAAASSNRDEVIAVGVDPNKKITAQTRLGGTWAAVAPNPLATVSDSFWWGFDVAYESGSGDALLVWNNGSTGTEPISSMVFDGTSWTTPTTVTAPLAGEAQQMQLAASPTSDEMILAVSNDSSEDYALVWDGTGWVDSDAQILDSAGGDDRTDVNVAYEQQTGEAMVVYGRNGTFLSYRTWDGAWSNQIDLLAPTGVTGDVRWTTVAADPNSDRLMFGILTHSREIWLTSWTGTFWQNGPIVTNSAAKDTAPTVAVAFEGQSGDALAAWSDSNDIVRYRTWSSGTWAGESPGPDLGDRPNSIMLDARPGTDEIMLGVQDDGRDLNYSLWSGSGFAPHIEVEGNTGENKNQPFTFLWH